MKSPAWKWIAAGIAGGALLGVPGLGDVLVLYGFWGSLMFMLPFLGILTVLVLKPGKRGGSLALQVGVGGFAGFALLYAFLTLDPAEGSPVLATLVGAWMAAWIAIIAALLTYRVVIKREPPVREGLGSNIKGHSS